MRFEFSQITQIWVQHFKSFSRVKPTQDQKVRFFQGNELKLTQVELFSFFHFKIVKCGFIPCVVEYISAS